MAKVSPNMSPPARESALERSHIAKKFGKLSVRKILLVTSSGDLFTDS